MFREILVQASDEETKVAVLEDGQLVEIYVERNPEQRLVGNIYKGVVKNVLPGMQAAFVDIGLEKNSFLYVDDALTNIMWEDKVRINLENARPNIRDIVKEGQEIVVQIAKEPVGTKGARVTTQITLPGRYLVLMPTVDYIGISRRIEDEAERERLKAVVEEFKPAGMGVIIRTVALGADVEDIREDLAGLQKMWERIRQKIDKVKAPHLLHRDLELIQRTLRDLFSDEFQRLSVNSQSVLERVEDYLEILAPHLKSKVFLSDTANLFAKYAIDQELAQALKRKVWLKSGGYLIIDEMEALTAIDVNTGKYVGSTHLADTIVKTNLAAAREIARQIRLRNIGGIIILDFIDMEEESHRDEVIKVLEEELKKDKTRAHVLGITPLGLVEMTRKKTSVSLARTMEKTCPCCGGKGRVLSEESVYHILKADLLEVAARTFAETIVIEAHEDVVAYMGQKGEEWLAALEKALGRKLVVKARADINPEKYEICPVYNYKNSTDKV